MGRVLRLMKSGIDTLPASHSVLDPHTLDGLPRHVDLWMGTLSKSLASCGGYIAGSAEIIEYLKLTSPGFVYSVGMPPPNAAAALAALNAIEEDPTPIQNLARNSRYFLDYARLSGLDTGLAQGTPIVPVVVGDSELAMRLSHALFEDGILAPPIIAPAVKNDTARLRFFITSDHTETQISHAVDLTVMHLHRLRERHAAKAPAIAAAVA
jgi:8-amino-7-oxononanoate synthase